jgi:DnaJ-class molecular chaperone
MDYYNILGIDKSSTADDIKKRYRKLSLKHHPDRPGGDAELFKKINEAYDVLGDPQKKRNYDVSGNPDGNPFMNAGMGGMPPGMDHIFSNIFGSFPGMSPGMQGMPNVRIFRNGQQIFTEMQKPPIINKRINISIKESFDGINYPIEIERWIMVNNVKRVEKEKIYIDIPKGIDSGEIIQIRNKGNIINDTNKGDIKIFINVTNNTKFKRSGLNLIFDKTISLKEALIGFKFEFKYLNDKTFAINNEENNIIKPNYQKEIRGMGMERKGIKGNLIIRFHIMFPDKFTNEQIKGLKELL